LFEVEIEKATIRKYLEQVSAYVCDHGWLPDDVTGYYDYIINMKKSASRQGELDILLLSIDCLLLDPSLNAPSFASLHNDFDPDEMEELLRYIRTVAYPNAPPLNSETIKDVKIVDVARSL
jgi:hypothetical protein